MMVLYLDNLRQRLGLVDLLGRSDCLGLVDLLGVVPFRSAVCVPARLALLDSVKVCGVRFPWWDSVKVSGRRSDDNSIKACGVWWIVPACMSLSGVPWWHSLRLYVRQIVRMVLSCIRPADGHPEAFRQMTSGCGRWDGGNPADGGDRWSDGKRRSARKNLSKHATHSKKKILKKNDADLKFSIFQTGYF